MTIDRRSFLHRAAAVIPAMHAGTLLAAPGGDLPVKKEHVSRFARLGLLTACDMEVMAAFYRDTLRLPIERDDRSLKVTAGETIIEFSHVDPQIGASAPYYHFAFNIPHNQLDSARSWIEPRCPLIKFANGDVVAHFQRWDAHAIYFLDPAGNILEFIARHTLKNDRAGDFSENNILCASEIGVVAPDVIAAADRLCKATTLNRYRPGDENFTAVGDEHGLFIVVKAGRRWFSSDRAAEVFEAEAHLRNEVTAVQLKDSQFAARPSQ